MDHKKLIVEKAIADEEQNIKSIKEEEKGIQSEITAAEQQLIGIWGDDKAQETLHMKVELLRRREEDFCTERNAVHKKVEQLLLVSTKKEQLHTEKEQLHTKAHEGGTAQCYCYSWNAKQSRIWGDECWFTRRIIKRWTHTSQISEIKRKVLPLLWEIFEAPSCVEGQLIQRTLKLLWVWFGF